MNTLEITFCISPDEEWFADLLMAELGETGFNGFADSQGGFQAYIPEECFRKEALDKLLETKDKRFAISYSVKIIPSQNWNELWEKNYFHPLVIKEEVLIRAPFHTGYPACPIEIVIEPNMAFGTGNHETTSMMMEIMLEMEVKGKKVLDMGCGTGILSILASKLGAIEVLAADNDPNACEVTRGNILLNNAGHVHTVLGDVRILKKEKFDLILANIHKNVLMEDIPVYSSCLRKGGVLVISGFFETDRAELRHQAEICGLTFSGFYEKTRWTALKFEF